MLRSPQTWVPALAFLAAIGVASIAVAARSDDPTTAPEPRASGAATRSEAPAQSQPVPVLETADTPAAPRPAGILTYLAGDGSYIAIDPSDPASRFDVVEPASPLVDGASGERYASPNGQYVASVRRDDGGVGLDVHEGTRLVISRQIAGPDDPDTLADQKAAARAIEGVPLRIAWSPDGQYLTYGSINSVPFSLGIIRTDDWSTLFRQVAGGYVGELAWAPDSSWLAISTYEIDRSNHTILLFNPRRLTVRHLIDGCAIVWSPDAAFLAIHREPSVASGVWITSPDGETQVEATADELAFPIAWTSVAS